MAMPVVTDVHFAPVMRTTDRDASAVATRVYFPRTAYIGRDARVIWTISRQS
jgi:hypothetical protein